MNDIRTLTFTARTEARWVDGPTFADGFVYLGGQEVFRTPLDGFHENDWMDELEIRFADRLRRSLEQTDMTGGYD